MLFCFYGNFKILRLFLYSVTVDKFYIGYTSNLEERIIRHNQKSKGFTDKLKDWELEYHEVFSSKHEAMTRDKQIKNWKSRAKILELINTI